MKHIKIFILWMAFFLTLTACQEKASSSLPGKDLPSEELMGHLVAYCWQNPSGRQSKTSPEDKEIMIVFESPNDGQRSITRDKYNLSDQHLSDYYIYKLGCIATGEEIRYIGNVLSWKPESSLLTFSEGSSAYLTDYDSRLLTDDFVVIEGTDPNIFGDYQRFISEPRGVYWSPNGKRFATLGRDLHIPGSAGDNIWVHNIEEGHYMRITKFRAAGDFVANASWSKDGNMLAVEYGRQSGIGIAQFEKNGADFQYFEITSLKYPVLSDNWPYAFRSMFQLFYDQENTAFNRYITRTSFPVWVNNDAQIVFAASDNSGNGTLFMVNSDGTNLRRFLPDMSGLIFMPTLSTDGKTLAFVRYPGWKDKSWVEIGTINIMTMQVQSLIVLSSETKKDLLISGMSWSPDGKFLAFSSNYEGESDIYVLSADGESWTNLTRDITGNAVSPIWKP